MISITLQLVVLVRVKEGLPWGSDDGLLSATTGNGGGGIVILFV